MPKKDREHFDEYTDQNKAKHRILNSYYPAYLTALKNIAARFHYIDAFAGPGAYEGTYPGSPLLSLQAFVNTGLGERGTISCVGRVS